MINKKNTVYTPFLLTSSLIMISFNDVLVFDSLRKEVKEATSLYIFLMI